MLHIGAKVYNKNTVMIDYAKNIDYLDCDIIRYYGYRDITIKQLKENMRKPDAVKYFTDDFNSIFADGIYSGIPGYKFTCVKIGRDIFI